MEIKDRNNFIKLYDTYGKLLTEKENIVLDNYLNQDLGESEIAENLGESRQSVYDAINKAKNKLICFEEKCKFIETQEKIKNLAIKLKNETALDKINEIVEQLNEIL